ncbi:hypothetical protein [Celeribacter arenosi]
MRTLYALLFLLAQPGVAQETYSDAFGILPADAVGQARASWGGVSTEGEKPAEPPQSVLTFIGPKSMVAGKDIGHAVALVMDRFGNLVSDGIAASFALGPRAMSDEVTHYGIADVQFLPDPNAGTFSGGASVGERQSPRALFRVVASIESLSPELEATASLVPETFSRLATRPMADRFANPIEDGVGAGFILRHEDGTTSVIPATVQEAIAEAHWLVRDVGSGGALTASLADQESASEPVELDPLRAAIKAPVRAWPLADLDAVAMRVGPMTTSAGHMLSDGAIVDFSVVSASGARAASTAWVQDGFADAILPIAPGDGPFAVSVESALGLATTSVQTGLAPDVIRRAE